MEKYGSWYNFQLFIHVTNVFQYQLGAIVLVTKDKKMNEIPFLA